MVEPAKIAELKRWLLRDVAYLSHRSDLHWNNPIVETIRELRRAALPAVFFGGTLRSLLLGRLSTHKRLGRPRDVDIVVADVPMDTLRERLEEHIVRHTRFGGLQIKRNSWHFDVWPLQQTLAFKEDESLNASFDSLPMTTFFNIEAVAVDVWTKPGIPRRVYSGDDRFFEGLLTQTIELNRESNPFPALCVVRSLVMASSMRLFIGPRLAEYLNAERNRVTNDELDDVQQHHYGRRRLHVADMRRLLDYVGATHTRGSTDRIKLPVPEQLLLWEEQPKAWPTMNFHVLDKMRAQ